MKRTIFYLLIIAMLSGCCKKENISSCVDKTEQAGFWSGLWHGMIIVPDFIGSLFWDDVTIYAPNNNGGWYAFGFVLGCGAIFGGGGASTKS